MCALIENSGFIALFLSISRFFHDLFDEISETKKGPTCTTTSTSPISGLYSAAVYIYR
jgi:hypothetical protein